MRGLVAPRPMPRHSSVANPTPANVTGLTTGNTVIQGQYKGCATTTGGALQCWGYDNRGQIGDGTQPRPRYR